MIKIIDRLSGEEPVIVHATGLRKLSGQIPLWALIRKNWTTPFISEEDRKTLGELTILTWNSTETKSILEECLGEMGVSCLVLGKGYNGKWTNAEKIRLTAKALAGVKTPYVMGLDSFDVIFTGSPAAALRRFKNMPCEMLFNSQVRSFYPSLHFIDAGSITAQWEAFQFSVYKKRGSTLNGGAWIGKTSFCLTFMEDCAKRDVDELIKKGMIPECSQARASDQIIYSWVFPDYYPLVQLDENRALFINLYPSVNFSEVKLVTPRASENFYYEILRVRDRAWVLMWKALNASRSFRGRLGLRRCQWDAKKRKRA